MGKSKEVSLLVVGLWILIVVFVAIVLICGGLLVLTELTIPVLAN